MIFYVMDDKCQRQYIWKVILKANIGKKIATSLILLVDYPKMYIVLVIGMA